MAKTIARYAAQGIGFVVWSPDNDGLPEFWFSTLDDVQEFAASCGWKLRRI